MKHRSLEGVRAVIFDFDGLLADTESLHMRTFLRVLNEEGIRLTAADIGSRFLGMHDRACFSIVFEEAGRTLPDAHRDALVGRKARYYEEGLAGVRLFPGARETIRGLSGRLPATIASGGRRAEIEILLDLHRLRDHFPWIVTAEDVSHPKPHPECFLRALEGLRERGNSDLEPAHCVVFEDSVHGVEAAQRAGMRCVAVTNSCSRELLGAADLVLDSLEEWRWSESR